MEVSNSGELVKLKDGKLGRSCQRAGPAKFSFVRENALSTGIAKSSICFRRRGE